MLVSDATFPERAINPKRAVSKNCAIESVVESIVSPENLTDKAESTSGKAEKIGKGEGGIVTGKQIGRAHV